MDRLTDRLAALAEEVGELAQPPGAAVTVWLARRRRRRLVAKAAGVGLFSVVVVGLLLNPLGRGFPDADTPRPWTASTPATTHRPGSLGQPSIYFAPRKLAPGERLHVVGRGCDPIRQGEVSIDPSDGVAMGPRTSVEISKDGRYSTWLTVPRTAKAGTYDLRVRCLSSEHGNGIVVRYAVVVTKPRNSVSSRSPTQYIATVPPQRSSRVLLGTALTFLARSGPIIAPFTVMFDL